MRSIAQLVAEVACRYWDLGSIPRSPHMFNNFCFNMFPCNFQPKVHYTHSHASLPHNLNDQSKGQNVKTTIHLGQPSSMWSWKVKKGLHSDGPKCFKNLPNGPETPPGLHSSILFSFSILILLIIFFNCFFNSIK